MSLSFVKVTKTVFTRCRHILKTVKNVTVAKFELSFTRCRFHKSIVKICRFQNLPAKNVPFSCEREAYSSHFSPFSKCDGCKIWASVHTIPEQFENGRNLDGKNSLQHFDAKETYLQTESRSVSFQKCLKMFCFHHLQVFTRCRFQNMSVRVSFSKSTVFKICRQKMCRFRVNGRPIRRIFRRFQNVPASCERSINYFHLNVWTYFVKGSFR